MGAGAVESRCSGIVGVIGNPIFAGRANMPRFLRELERGRNMKGIRSMITFQDAVLGGWGRRVWSGGS